MYTQTCWQTFSNTVQSEKNSNCPICDWSMQSSMSSEPILIPSWQFYQQQR